MSDPQEDKPVNWWWVGALGIAGGLTGYFMPDLIRWLL